MKTNGSDTMAVPKESLAEAIISAASAPGAALKVQGAGAAGAVGGWMLDAQVLALVGLCVTVAGFVTHLVLGVRDDARKRKELRMKEREHRALMKSQFGVDAVDTE